MSLDLTAFLFIHNDKLKGNVHCVTVKQTAAHYNQLLSVKNYKIVASVMLLYAYLVHTAYTCSGEELTL